jgi:hypothetical protein
MTSIGPIRQVSKGKADRSRASGIKYRVPGCLAERIHQKGTAEPWSGVDYLT